MDYKAEFIRIFSENVSRPGAQQLLDWLAENVEGHIPAFDDLIEEAKPLVRLQGIYKEAQV